MTVRSDDRVEAALRDVLSGFRPGAAPPGLRASVDRVPDLSRPSRVPTRLRSAIALAGGLSALAVAAVVGIVTIPRAFNLQTVPYVEPGTGAPTPATFDPSVVGPGIVTSFSGTLGSVAWGVAVLGWIALAAVAVIVGRRWRRIAVVGGLVLALALGGGAWALTTHPGLEFGGAFGPVLGLDVRADPPRASHGPGVWYVTAEPGAPFALAFTMHNPGPLPIRYLGVREPNPPGVHFYRWAAVWQIDDSHGGTPGPEEATSFHGVDVAPGEFLTLYLVARASDCAYGPEFRLEDAASFSFSSRPGVSIAYSIAGLTATSEVELPVVIAEPFLGNCPAE